MLSSAEQRLVDDARRDLVKRGRAPIEGPRQWKRLGRDLFFCDRTHTAHACGTRCKFRGVSAGAEVCELTGVILVPTITVAAFGAMDSAGNQTMFGNAEQRSKEHFAPARRNPTRARRTIPKRPVSGTMEHAADDVVLIWKLVTHVLNSKDAIDARNLAYAKRIVELGRIVHAIREISIMSAQITGVVNLTAIVCVADSLAKKWLEAVPVPMRGAGTPLVKALVTNIHLVWMVHVHVMMKHAHDAVMTAGHNVPTVAVSAPTATAATVGTASGRKRRDTVNVTLEQVTIAMMRWFTMKDGIAGGVSAEAVLRRLMPEDTELCKLLKTNKPYPAMRYSRRLVAQFSLSLMDMPLPPLDDATVEVAPAEVPPAILKRIVTRNRAEMGQVEALSSVLSPPEPPPDKRRRRKAATGGKRGGGTRATGGRRTPTHDAAGAGAPPVLRPVIVQPPSRARRKKRRLTGRRTCVLLNPEDSLEPERTEPALDSTRASPATPEEM